MIFGAGHGWVRPLPSGFVARCGGPGICSLCGEELALLTAAVKELFYWEVSDHTPWFHHKLYTLISSADVNNRRRIAEGFPWEAIAFALWENAEDQWAFFEKFGFKRNAVPIANKRYGGSVYLTAEQILGPTPLPENQEGEQKKE